MGDYWYDVFLSYSSADQRAVKELARRLEEERVKPYFDEWEMIAGRQNQVVLAEALRDSKTCAVFIGPSRLGPWQKEEIQVAIGRRVGDPKFHVIPILLPGAERPRRGDVAHLEFLIHGTWVEFTRTLDDARAFRRLVCGIKGERPGPEPGERQFDAGHCPYRGLEAFGPEDAAFFFGRAHLTDWLVSDLRRELRSAQGVRLLAVLGPSGSGKSSVVLAGLVPRLKQGAIEGSERWPIAILRPGDDPLTSLAVGIVAQFQPAGALPDVRGARRLRDDLLDDPHSLDLFARLALDGKPPESRLLVVVDQFEEVFTYRPTDDAARQWFEAARARMFDNLLHAAATPGGRVVVVLTMRSDFLGACAPFPRLNDALNAHVEQVGPMREEELREAIKRPAYLVGCELEQGLTELLLDDVRGQPGALPLLQFTLKALWEKKDVRRLIHQAYTEIGGVQGALQDQADAIFRSFGPAEQELCRRIFLRLVQPGQGTEDTKRRVALSELLPDDPAQAEAVRKVLLRLSDWQARLITTDRANAPLAESSVEVAHEALIRGWPQLRQWIDADRAGLRLHRQLTEAAREWVKQPDDAGFLFQGTRLAQVREWVAAQSKELNELERQFLDASVQQEQDRIALQNAMARRQAQAEGLLRALETAEIREIPRLRRLAGARFPTDPFLAPCLLRHWFEDSSSLRSPSRRPSPWPATWIVMRTCFARAPNASLASSADWSKPRSAWPSVTAVPPGRAPLRLGTRHPRDGEARSALRLARPRALRRPGPPPPRGPGSTARPGHPSHRRASDLGRPRGEVGAAVHQSVGRRGPLRLDRHPRRPRERPAQAAHDARHPHSDGLPTQTDREGKLLKTTKPTDAIFAHIAAVQTAVRGDPGILEISIDTQAKVDGGDYVRGG